MGNSPYSTLVLIALMVVAFYFLIIRPQKKRQQAQLTTMKSLTPGTRVLLTSGIFGRIVEIGEKQAVLETSPGAHLTVLKQAIARVAQPSDEDTEWESIDDEDGAAVDDTVLDETPRDEAPLDHAAEDVTTPTSHPSGSTAGGSTAVGHHDVRSSADEVNGWRSESTSRPTGADQDTRSGSSTTPIKD